MIALPNEEPAKVWKCLSIRQPWAWLILHGGKDVENRPQNSHHRGPFLIHAAQHFTSKYYDDAVQWVLENVMVELAERIPSPSELKYGGIVGSVNLVEVVRPGDDGGHWHNGQFGYRLDEAKPLPFVPCKGALGFWRPQPETLAELVQKGAVL